MPQKSRELYPGAIYHVFTRGNCKKNIFETQEDFKTFLAIVSNVRKIREFDVYSFCLMNNHFHFLIKTPNADLPEIMYMINQKYAMYFNKVHEEIGYVFQGRYKSKTVKDDGYLLQLIAYIHLNPYHAFIVDDLINWEWSSFNTYLNKNYYNFMNLDYPRKLLGIDDFEKEFLCLLERNKKVKLCNEIYNEKFMSNIILPELKKKIFLIDSLDLPRPKKTFNKVCLCLKEYNLNTKETAELLDISKQAVRNILNKNFTKGPGLGEKFINL